MFEKLNQFILSEDGKKSLQEFIDTQKRQHLAQVLQLERFHVKYNSRLSELIEKVIEKYSSGEYKDSWLRRGIEHTEDLFWILLNYAERLLKKR